MTHIERLMAFASITGAKVHAVFQPELSRIAKDGAVTHIPWHIRCAIQENDVVRATGNSLDSVAREILQSLHERLGPLLVPSASVEDPKVWDSIEVQCPRCRHLNRDPGSIIRDKRGLRLGLCDRRGIQTAIEIQRSCSAFDVREEPDAADK